MYIVHAADDFGHKIVFTTPPYSYLQPIELIWAHIKRNVQRQYTIGTNLSILKGRLDDQFESLTSTAENLVVQMIISHVYKRIMELEQEIREEDETQLPLIVLDENDSVVTVSSASTD